MKPQLTVKGKGGIAVGLVFCSAALMAFLGDWEEGNQRQLTVYADKLASGLPTVCRGLTRHITSMQIIVGETWTEAKCEAEERRAVQMVQRQITGCFEVAPPQSVFDAATSHAWNFGAYATCTSLAMDAWNKGDWALGCRRLQLSDGGRPVWSYVPSGRKVRNAQGKLVDEMKFVRGLANRRAAERTMCEGS